MKTIIGPATAAAAFPNLRCCCNWTGGNLRPLPRTKSKRGPTRCRPTSHVVESHIAMSDATNTPDAARSALVWSHSRPWATLCTLGDWRLSKGERGEGNEDCRWQQWQFNVFLLGTLRIENRGSRGETNIHANIDHTPAGALSLSVVWLSVVLSRSSSLCASRLSALNT